jgi:hypothetical protein
VSVLEQEVPERHDLPDFRIFRSISSDRKICAAASLLSRVKLVHHFVEFPRRSEFIGSAPSIDDGTSLL